MAVADGTKPKEMFTVNILSGVTAPDEHRQVSISLTQAAVAKILPQADVAELIGSDASHLKSYGCVITLQIQRATD